MFFLALLQLSKHIMVLYSIIHEYRAVSSGGHTAMYCMKFKHAEKELRFRLQIVITRR